VAGDQVVAVDEGQGLALGVPDAGVAGRAQPLVFLRHDAEPVVAVTERLRHHGTAVTRPVVDEDHLEVVERLADQRVEAVSDVRLDVVERHDHTEPGFHAASSRMRVGDSHGRTRTADMATRQEAGWDVGTIPVSTRDSIGRDAINGK